MNICKKTLKFYRLLYLRPSHLFHLSLTAGIGRRSAQGLWALPLIALAAVAPEVPRMSPCSRSWSVSLAGGCAGPPRRMTSRPGPSPSRSRSTSRAAAGAPGALGLRQALARVRHHALPRPAPPLTAVSTPWLAALSARSRDGGTAEQGPSRTILLDDIAVARRALLWN